MIIIRIVTWRPAGAATNPVKRGPDSEQVYPRAVLTAEHSRLSALVATTERLWRSSTARLRRAYPYPESIRSSRIGGHRGHEAGPCSSARRTDLAIDHRDPFRITEGMGRGGGLTVLFSY